MKVKKISFITPIFVLAILILLSGCAPSIQKTAMPPEEIKLDVVYPRIERGDSIFVVPPVDSTFAFGSVRPTDSQVFVNGVPAQVWENGAFLAYFPLDTTNRIYAFQAIAPDGRITTDTIKFSFPTRKSPPTGKIKADSINYLLPTRITITEKYSVIRTMPDGAFWLFPPVGTEALADSFAAPYYRIALNRNLHGWIDRSFVELDTSHRTFPSAIVYKIKVKAENEWTVIRIPLKERLLFHLQEYPEVGKFVLDLFGAVSKIDQIEYDPDDKLVRWIGWNQMQDDLLRLEVSLSTTRFWGYDICYEGDYLTFKVRRPPRISVRLLKDRTIVLDPGHGGEQTGAIGPSRLPEKEPNLRLTKRLKELLEAEGARVILTRASDSTVGIYDRIEMAVNADAEILLSLHNNALPNGMNPFIHRGSAVYYYRSQSRDLAVSLHEQLLKTSSLPDHGFYYKNLALARPTQMLAVLIECAFIIHPEEEDLLRQKRFINQLASGIVKGIKEYLRSCLKENRTLKDRTYYWPFHTLNLPMSLYKPAIPNEQIHLHVP